MRPAVLYVDPDAGNRVVFEARFRDRFDVYTAPSGAAARDLLQHRSFVAVIAEERLPAMSGTQFLHAVRSEYPQVQRIITSSLEVPLAVESGLARRCILKPWDCTELLRTLESAVERRLAAPTASCRTA